MAERDTDWIYVTNQRLSSFKPKISIQSGMNSPPSPYNLVSQMSTSSIASSPISAGRKQLSNDAAMLRVLGMRKFHPDQPSQFAEFARKIRNTPNISEIVELLEKVSTKTLLDAIPQSLPVIDAIYCRFTQGVEFPKLLLKPEYLVSQVVWWLVKTEPNTVKGRSHSKRTDPELQFKMMIPHLRSVLDIVQKECPELMRQLKIKIERIERALESLGLHGLVNYGDNKLIFVAEAARIELNSHQERVKSVCHRIDKLCQAIKTNFGGKTDSKFVVSLNSADSHIPSQSNHQRLMTLRASEVDQRQQQNETILELLTDALENMEMDSLIRILQKRITSDKDILTQLNALKSVSQNCNAIFGVDPVVSQLLLQFKNAYQKILSVLTPIETSPVLSLKEDSGVDMDTSDETYCSSPETIDEEHLQYAPKPVRSVKKLGPVAQQLKYKYRQKKHFLHRSLLNLNHSSIEIHPANSECNLSNFRGHPTTIKSQSLQNLRSQNLDLDTFYLDGHENMFPNSNEGGRNTYGEGSYETARLKSEVSRLNSKLSMANERILNLSSNNNKWPRPDYDTESDLPNPLLPSGSDPTSIAVRRYSNLFAKDRVETVEQINQLPEIRESNELQLKILFSVMVLAFRSVYETVESKREKIWRDLGIDGDDCAKYVMDFESSLYEFFNARAKTTHGMNNAKEVTTQIWKTLYDFPSLKSCIRFNRFILDCVDVAWEIVTAPDIKFRLEYESVRFCPEKHLRFHTSFLKSADIKRYVWPGLTDIKGGKCVIKGIVIT